MPFALFWLPDEPIVVVRIEVPLEQHLDGVVSVSRRLWEVLEQSETTIYIVLDLTDQSPAFSDILLAIQMLAPWIQWITESQARAVLVGSHPLLPLAVKRFRQQLSIDLQHYATMELALAAVRAQIAGKK